MKLFHLFIALFLICGFCACQLVPAEQQQLVETLQMPTLVETAEPTSSATLTRLPTVRPVPTLTPGSTPVPLSGPLLSADNIALAVPDELKFPATGSGFYWPGGAKLLLLQDTSFLQINLEPLKVGAELPIDAPGNHLAASPDGAQVLVQAGDGGLFLWNAVDKSRRPINYGVASFGHFSPDGKLIVLGSPEKIEAAILEVSTLKIVKTLGGFETAAPVYEALVNPSNDRILWHSRAKIAWMDIQSGKLGAEYGYQDFIDGLAFSPDGKWLVVTAGGLLQVLSTQSAGTPDARDLVMKSEGGLSPAVFSPGSTLVAAGVGSEIQVWETTDWKLVAKLGQSSVNIRQVGFSPDGRVLAGLDQENNLTIWRIR